jgi:hypothetical protein
MGGGERGVGKTQFTIPDSIPYSRYKMLRFGRLAPVDSAIDELSR